MAMPRNPFTRRRRFRGHEPRALISRRPAEPRRDIKWRAPLRIYFTLDGLAAREHASLSGILEAVVVIGLRNLGERVADIPGLLQPGAWERRSGPVMQADRAALIERAVAAKAAMRDLGLTAWCVAKRVGYDYRTVVRTLAGRQVSVPVLEIAERMVSKRSQAADAPVDPQEPGEAGD